MLLVDIQFAMRHDVWRELAQYTRIQCIPTDSYDYNR